jgi:anthranilate synthase/aminodeoxychorismate synthase-like glutamine amidotransferase
MTRVLVLDNYDSFTYNLVQELGALGAHPEVFRNDAITVEQALALKVAGIVISPGPCAPDSAGISVPLIRAAAGRVPVLGVCLGHQAIGAAFGGRVVRNVRIVHGKASPVRHRKAGLFENLPSPFQAGRYHSLVIERKSMPRCLEITAWTDEGEVMGVRHRAFEVEGVQFHPESVLTPHGMQLLAAWLERLSRRDRRRRT